MVDQGDLVAAIWLPYSQEARDKDAAKNLISPSKKSKSTAARFHRVSMKNSPAC